MAVYDRRNMDRIRRDSIIRSQEMYSQSMPRPETGAGDSSENRNIKRKEKDRVHNVLEELLDGPIDGDKLLIAALILLLIREGGDKKLILALGYILL